MFDITTLSPEQLAALSPEQLAALSTGKAPSDPSKGKGSTTEPTTTTEPKVYRWKLAICNRHGFPTTKGSTFEYVGKRQTTTHRIVGVEGKGDNRVILTNRV